MFEKIGIIGLGLIGGSLARAIKKYDKNIKVAAVDIDGTSLIAAEKEGVVDTGFYEITAALNDCGLIIVCTGPDRVAADILKVNAVTGGRIPVTDVCSVKGFGGTIPQTARYVGGHPMAGTEKSGYSSSGADLFRGAQFIITEETEAAKAHGDRERVLEFIEIIGAKPVETDNLTHDRTLAHISHLPHIAAYLLSDYCLKDGLSKKLGAGGFKGLTRIASSDPKLWTNIISMNKDCVLDAVGGFIEELQNFEELLKKDDLQQIENIFTNGKQRRDELC